MSDARAEMFIQATVIQRLLNPLSLRERHCLFSLSLRERVGVRGSRKGDL